MPEAPLAYDSEHQKDMMREASNLRRGDRVVTAVLVYIGIFMVMAMLTGMLKVLAP